MLPQNFTSPQAGALNLFVYTIFSFFIDFGSIFMYNLCFFMWKLSRDDSGIVQDIFKSYVLSVVHAAGAFFAEKYRFMDLWDMQKLKKLHCCSYVVIFHHIDAVRARLRPSKNEQKQNNFGGLTKLWICFQVTPTTTTTAARRQLSNLVRPLTHDAQGWNIPFR